MNAEPIRVVPDEGTQIYHARLRNLDTGLYVEGLYGYSPDEALANLVYRVQHGDNEDDDDALFTVSTGSVRPGDLLHITINVLHRGNLSRHAQAQNLIIRGSGTAPFRGGRDVFYPQLSSYLPVSDDYHVVGEGSPFVN